MNMLFTFALMIYYVSVRVSASALVSVVFPILISLTTVYASPWVDNYYSLHYPGVDLNRTTSVGPPWTPRNFIYFPCSSSTQLRMFPVCTPSPI